MKSSINWQSVPLEGWTLHDAALARRLGCSRERVRQQRKALGITVRTNRLSVYATKYRPLLEKLLADGTLGRCPNVPTAMKVTGLNQNVIQQFMIEKRLLFRPLIIQKLAAMNFDLPNSILSVLWDVDYQRICQTRYREKKGSRWRANYHAHLSCPELLQAFEEECDKATNFVPVCVPDTRLFIPKVAQRTTQTREAVT